MNRKLEESPVRVNGQSPKIDSRFGRKFDHNIVNFLCNTVSNNLYWFIYFFGNINFVII